MPFIGTTPTQGFVSSFPKQSFTPNGSTTVFTLTNPVATANDLEVFVGNVRQEPTTAYTAAGTTLTMSEAPASGLNFYVINKSFAQVTTTPPVNSITTDKILNANVTTAKIADNNVTAAKLPSTLDLSSKTLTIPTASVKPMYVHAVLNSLQTLTNDTITKVAFNGQAHSNGLTWDTSNYRCTFNATTAGTYRIQYSYAFFSANNSISEMLSQVRKNNSAIHNGLHMASGTGGGTVIGALRHAIGTEEIVHTFADGDYVDFWAHLQVNSGNADIHERQYGSQVILMRIDD